MQLKLDEVLERARKFILLGKLDDAEVLVNAILKAQPKHKLALKQRAAIGAKRVLPNDQRGALMQAFNSGDLDGAIAQSIALQKRFPRATLLYTIQGAAHAQKGEHEKGRSRISQGSGY